MGHWTGVKHSIDGAGPGDAWPGSAHEARRFMSGHLARCTAVDTPAFEGDKYGRGDEPAVLIEPKVIEGEIFASVAVGDARTCHWASGFTGFLDGTQDVGIVNLRDGIPIVWGTVSAAVRVRENKRMIAWRRVLPAVERRYYLPFRYVDGLDPALQNSAGVVDTGVADSGGKFPSRHPAALMESAVQLVQRDRERLELTLAEEWCGTERTALFVDGSITASAIVSASRLAVGVVKSHRRLYADGNAFHVLAGLGAGYRSSVFRVSPKSRHPVASWYLRLRKSAGRDTLFGLVRIEAAETDDIVDRANEISQWVLAEGAPLALPDGRWDKMAYGIRDTEEFLRAIS